MKRLLALLLIILLASTVSAHESHEMVSYEAEYEIVGNTVIVTENLELEQPIEEFHWSIPKDATGVEVKGLTFETQEFNTYKSLTINNPKTDITIKYISKSTLEENKDYFFILDLGNINTETKTVRLKLPKGATLKHALGSPTPSIIPKTENVKTDGKRIIITWSPVALKDNSAILTIFNPQKEDNTPIIVTLVIIILIAVWFSRQKKQSKTAQNVEHSKSETPQPEVPTPIPEKEPEITRNLFEEEKQIIEALLQSETKELWQKQLEIKTGLSKVKLSRKLRNLEQKGLIEKIPYGNTNKIRLKTPSKD